VSEAVAYAKTLVLQARLEAVSACAKLRRQKAALQDAFTAWRRAVTEAHQMIAAADRRAGSLLVRAMNAWIAYYQHRLRTFQFGCQARSFRFCNLCSKALQAWITHCTVKMRALVFMEAAVSSLQRSMMRRLFLTWGVQVAGKRAVTRQLWLKGVVFHRACCLSSALTGWREMVRTIPLFKSSRFQMHEVASICTTLLRALMFSC
jgi:hypothetical protein